jgi:nitrate/nitrite transporter NarK
MGFVWVALWWFWYRNTPAEQPGITSQKLAELHTSSSAPGHVSIAWALFFRSKQLWLISMMYGLYVWGSWFYFSWLHIHLIKGRGFTESEMGSVASIPFFMGACGNLLGGFLSDHLARKYGLRNGRRWVGCFSLASSSCLFLATALTADKWTSIVLLTSGLFVLDFLVPTAWAVCLDVGQSHAGAVTAVMSTAGQASGFVCTVLFGYVATSTGSYDAPLSVISAMVMISAVLFWFIDPRVADGAGGLGDIAQGLRQAVPLAPWPPLGLPWPWALHQTVSSRLCTSASFSRNCAAVLRDAKRASDQRNRGPASNRLLVLVDPAAKAISTFVRVRSLNVAAIDANGR